MNNSDELKHVLEVEVALGHSASTAWAAVKPFFDEKKELLHQAFEDTLVSDPDSLVQIKMQMNVLKGMENYFKEKITTGTLATITLNNGD